MAYWDEINSSATHRLLHMHKQVLNSIPCVDFYHADLSTPAQIFQDGCRPNRAHGELAFSIVATWTGTRQSHRTLRHSREKVPEHNVTNYCQQEEKKNLQNPKRYSLVVKNTFQKGLVLSCSMHSGWDLV
jgi:hypothetical protein